MGNNWISRLKTCFGKKRLDRDLDRELAFHIEMETRERTAKGMPEAAARRQARIVVGNTQVLREQAYDSIGLRPWIDFRRDLSHAFRMLRREPQFTLVTVLTLALGIGANTAIFSVVDGVLLRPAPIPDIDRIAMLWETDRNTGTIREPASVPDFQDLQARSRMFSSLGALAAAEANLRPPSGEPERVTGLQVTSGVMSLIGVRPLIGRPFEESDDRLDTPPVVMLSESMWARTYSRDPGVVGQTLLIDEAPSTVIGVLPESADFGVYQLLANADYARGFVDRGGSRVDVWSALKPDPKAWPRSTHPIFVAGRLAPDATLEQAQQETVAIMADLERQYPRDNANRGAFVEPLNQVIFSNSRPALLVLMFASALVLLVACVNVANLQLARSSRRAQEVAVRSTLGAGRWRLCAQFALENLTLVLLATAAGVGVAFASLRILIAMVPPDVPRLSEVSINPFVLAVTTITSMIIGLVFGLIPTLQQGRELATAGRTDGGSGGETGKHHRVRSALVIAELALAVVLVAGAGLLIRSFWELQKVQPGFRASGVLKAEYQLPRTRYPADFSVWPNFKEMHAFNNRLLERVRSLPGVEMAALAGNHPLDPGFTNSFTIVGREAESRSLPEISVRRVTPEYFRTVGLSHVRGRLLEASDHTFAPPVLLINQEAARRFFPDRDPIGSQIRLYGANRPIVGVVANERFQGLAKAPPIALYLPLAQVPSVNGSASLLVRTSGDPESLISAVRQTIRQLDSGLAVFGIETLENTVSRSVSHRRFMMALLGTFAAVALTLAAIGIYGVLSYGIARRTREIGIRVALGAQPHRLVRLVLGEGLMLTVTGLVIGLLGALAGARILKSLLFGVTPTDPATLASVAVIFAVVACAACLIPVLRALRIAPVVALRQG